MGDVGRNEGAVGMLFTRRDVLTAATGAGLMALGFDAHALGAGAKAARRFHYSVSIETLEAEPDLLGLVHDAGITDVWLGWWVGPPVTDEVLAKNRHWVERIEAAGMGAHLITIPLGHPADGPATPKFPVDGHWGVRPDGTTYAGTAYHPPLLPESLAAQEKFRGLGIRRFFVDDDFRLAQSPFDIGGCFCPQHRAAFLKKEGFPDSSWAELLDAVRGRKVTPVLRAWIEFICDELSGMFRSLRRGQDGATQGVMVMYMGCERAGIRLPDYRGVPFRVGELMFEDAGFSPPKGKTDELYSVLLHRRFASPELAFSETTAYPPEKLSPRNGMAKLCTSTIADVRNTMFMCMNLADWSRREPGILPAAIKKHAAIHAKLAGHALVGPFKHFYGEHSRLAGGDWPYSLFLGIGVPFEVTPQPVADGWTFLSDHDARALADGHLRSPGTEFVYRPAAAKAPKGRGVADTLPDLFAFRRAILPELAVVPYVEEEEPVVCAWYPSARAVLLWNLQEQPVDLTLVAGTERRSVRVEARDIELVEGIALPAPHGR